jgi:hypothetical protein
MKICFVVSATSPTLFEQALNRLPREKKKKNAKKRRAKEKKAKERNG